MVSIKEVAMKCGVSVATVSKALNDKSDIGEETKQKIRRIAEEMGYTPNATARALRTKRSHSIGLLFGEQWNSALTDEFFSHVINAFKSAVEKRGYEILFINKEIGNHTMTYLEHCRYRGVDGLLMAHVPYQNPEVQELLQSELPIVTMDRIVEGKISLCFDYAQGIRDLVTYIHEMGHSKIAYIHGENGALTGVRVNSFCETMKELGLEVPAEYIREGRYLDYERAAEITAELLDLPNPPTCILYPNDFSALGGIGKIYERKLSIPEDISVAGYDGIPLARAMTPPLTTLAQDSEKMGEEMAEQLIALIEKPESAQVKRIMIKGKVLSGKSVKRL
ncbi:MAG: LacI family DNA-binding transcriptional regulator [Lachnospiraceae bacterium]|nr:LacI family DNA-binding transcriptional regulator [Lachnospiraceae bacterium]